MDLSFLCFLLQEANKPPDSWFELKVNTHVYVTGLPDDVTVDEVSFDNCYFLSWHISWGNMLIWEFIAGSRSIFQVWDNKGGNLFAKKLNIFVAI